MYRCLDSPPDVPNSRNTVSDTGTMVGYLCDPEYFMDRGDKILNCTGRGWTGNVPVCKLSKYL